MKDQKYVSSHCELNSFCFRLCSMVLPPFVIVLIHNRNFSSMDLSGFLSPDIANLTALTNMYVFFFKKSVLLNKIARVKNKINNTVTMNRSFAHNRLVGSIPDLSNLRNLQRL